MKKNIITIIAIPLLLMVFAISCSETAKDTGKMLEGKWKAVDYQNTSLSESENVQFQEERKERIAKDVYTFEPGKVIIDDGMDKTEFLVTLSEDKSSIILTGPDNSSFTYLIESITDDKLVIKTALNKGFVIQSFEKSK